jgi:ubiquinone/menaquinone biosynthesis C-methylase UbiE
MKDGRGHDDKVVDQHTRQASGYAKLTREAGRQQRPVLQEEIGTRPDDELLDVACGPGSIALALAPHVARGTGLDLTAAMLDEARAAAAEAGIANLEWVEGDAAAMPFDDGAFSLVTCSAAFHHFSQPAKVLSEMARVCRPGGRVVVMDVTPDEAKVDGFNRIEKMRDPSHGHTHSLAELREMGATLGLAEPETRSRLSGPLLYAAILETSFPEEHSREELLDLMRADAASGEDSLGFRAELAGETVMVSYPTSTVIWTKPAE